MRGALLRGPVQSLRSLLGRARATRAWQPEHARLLWFQVSHRNRNCDAHLSDWDHLTAAASWLGRAQDAMADGGVGGRYALGDGWTSSYPETTGYIVPTLLALARELGDDRFRERAARCVRFLLALQLPDGAFPGGEVHENTTRPSVFNTAQILSGLAVWHAQTGDARVLESARRAADWLVDVQDADGAWRTHVYEGVATSYSAFASCWLAELGAHQHEPRYRDAAARHLAWVMRHYDPETGWFDRAGFTASDHDARRALTHTIAYTLWGVLRTSEVLAYEPGVTAVARAAHGIARRLELSGWLPGVLDHRWRGCATYACLTGNAQLALVWLRLYDRHGASPVLLNAALKALDLVKRAQPMFMGDPELRGGIPGSDPIWGAYLSNAFPNWAAKFFIDALLETRRVLGRISLRPRGRWTVPADVPRALPPLPAVSPSVPVRVVLYSSPRSHKVPQMVTAWSASGFRPAAVVFERGAPKSVADRIAARIREAGVRGLGSEVVARLSSAAHRRNGRASEHPDDWPDPIRFCRERGIPVIEVDALDSPRALAVVRGLRPDVAIHAGAGILRLPILGVPRLGTLNAHMGLLPYYRGVNVAEWARFSGDPVGCTVHLLDRGIDTGGILCVRLVDPAGVRTIAELRDRVDRAQIALLGEVLRFITATGTLPPMRAQRPEEGAQFFRMHAGLAAALEGELRE